MTENYAFFGYITDTKSGRDMRKCAHCLAFVVLGVLFLVTSSSVTQSSSVFVCFQ